MTDPGVDAGDYHRVRIPSGADLRQAGEAPQTKIPIYSVPDGESRRDQSESRRPGQGVRPETFSEDPVSCKKEHHIADDPQRQRDPEGSVAQAPPEMNAAMNDQPEERRR